MSRLPDFAAQLPDAVVELLRALDLELGDWVASHSGDAALGLAACAAAAAEALGHSGVRLDVGGRITELPGFPPLPPARLPQGDWLGDGSRPTPLVLDAHGRLYLWRQYVQEGRVAAELVARSRDAGRGTRDSEQRPVAAGAMGHFGAACAAGATSTGALSPSPESRVPSPGFIDDLTALFADSDPTASADQRAAVAAAPDSRLLVIGGGPGTGKTSTAVRRLALLLKHRHALGLGARPQVRLAAPTGKAGQRLAEAVRAGRQALLARLPAEWHEALALIPDAEASTLHRLLGHAPLRERPEYHRDNPLPVDLLVVDEASMIDLGQMAALLDALRPDARLILLGDADQLAAVGAGSVLADLVAAAATRPALGERVATLGHVWRAAGALVTLPALLRAGEPEAFVEALTQACATPAAATRTPPIRWRPLATPTALADAIDGWLTEQGPRLERLADPTTDPLEALAALREAVLLTALREGPFGAAGVNAAIERRLRLARGIDPEQAWYPGRPLLITRNAPGLGLYNGDLGIVREGPDGLQAWFERVDANGRPLARPLSPRLLPEHASAYAMTIHKAQGSEYDDVTLVLPPEPEHPLLSRQLLYTGMTRARERLSLWAGETVLRAALQRRAARGSGLLQRLQGLAGEA